MNNVVGIDIGGTKTSIGLVNLRNGKVIEKITFPSKTFQNDEKNLKNIVKKTIDFNKKLKFKKIGIGVPELINNNAIIKGAYNFKWNNKDLKKYFPKKYTIAIDSDVRNHLRAERFYGYGKNKKNYIYINVGTGLSYSHYKNNQIYSGANGYAIHFASSKITLYNPKNNKKISLVPEDFYSGKSIIKFQNKYKSNVQKLKYLNNVADSLASLIGNLINTTDPNMIVFGGGVILNNRNFKTFLFKNLKKYIISTDSKKIKIYLTKLKEDTGLIGAAALHK